MSVYITVKQAKLLFNPKYDVQCEISSSKTSLYTSCVHRTKNPQWNTSLIASDNERKLRFVVRDMKSEEKGKVLGSAYLDFNYFLFSPEKQILYTVLLQRDHANAGQLQLIIFYNENKNFLGEIQFYEFSSMLPEIQTTNKKEEMEKETEFYKGPCKNKNFFSCCDVSVVSGEFEVLQVPYGQKK